MKFFKYLILLPLISFAQEEVMLYPEQVKSTYKEAVTADGIIYNVSNPSISVFPARQPNGTAMVVAPGGAFHLLAWQHEGVQVARWLNSKGITAVVLKYRLTPCETDDPGKEVGEKMKIPGKVDTDSKKYIEQATQDGLAAVRWLRKNKEKYQIDPQKVGMVGFSAGATLTMSVLKSAPEEEKLNFAAPIYPYEKAIIGNLMPAKRTPLFLAVAADDGLGFFSHSLHLAEQWHDAGQPVSLHVYQDGDHGFGMLKKNTESDFWIEDLGNWLVINGLVEKKKYASEAERRLHEDWGFLGRYKQANDGVNKPNLVLLGNSITEGWYRSDEAWFTKNNFVGRGISGQTSPQLLVRFRQDVINLNPKAVMIMIGTNDVAQNTGYISTDETVANIKSMCELAVANGIIPMIASVPPASAFPWRKEIKPGDMILEINGKLKAYAVTKGYQYIDFHTASKNAENGLDKELAGDGVHPTLKMYQEIMEPLVEKAYNQLGK